MGIEYNWYALTPDVVLRYADILLTYAEAQTRADGSPNALARQCLKDVRNRAYKGVGSNDKDAEVDAIPSNEFAEAVVEERLYEFCGNELTSSRWFDLIRLEKVEEVLNSMKPVEEDEATFDVMFSYFEVPGLIPGCNSIMDIMNLLTNKMILKYTIQEMVYQGIASQAGLSIDEVKTYVSLGDYAQVPGAGISFAQLFNSEFLKIWTDDVEKYADDLSGNPPTNLTTFLDAKKPLLGLVSGLLGEDGAKMVADMFKMLEDNIDLLKGYNRLRDYSHKDYFWPVPNRDTQMNPALAGNNDYLNN